MKGNQLIVVGGVAVVALGAALLLSGRSDQASGGAQGGSVGAPLVPGLDGAINDIASVQLIGAEQTLTLARSDDGWSVREKDGYAAEISRVRELLLALADARLLEEKTSNPENYGALGLDAPTTIALTGDGFDEQRISIGNSARRDSATYVRRGDEAPTWLVSGRISAQADPVSWVDPIIINIRGERIQSVSIAHEDGEQLRIEKAGRNETGYVVKDIPAGKELRYESIANAIGTSLANLRLEDVRAADSEESPLAGDGEALTRVRYLTFDGLVLEASTFAQGETRWVSFEASVDEAQAERFAPPGDDGETDASPGDEDAPVTDEQAPSLAEVQAEADTLNAQLSPWVFAIGRYKAEQLTRRMDDLVQDPPPTPDAS